MMRLLAILTVVGLVVAACSSPDGTGATSAGETTTTVEDGTDMTQPPVVTTAAPQPEVSMTVNRSEDTTLGGDEDQVISSIAVGGPGLVAVGWDTDRRSAAVWTSSDGNSWQRVEHDEDVFGGRGSQWMFGVTAGGPGLVAVGASARLGDRTAVVWTSADGLTWTRLPDGEEFTGLDGYAEMKAVTGGKDQLVAVGAAGFQDRDGAIWTSADGATWTRVADPDGALGGDKTQIINAVTLGGPGFVAVGRQFDLDSADSDAAVWVSSDGVVWSRVLDDLFVAGADQEMFGVTAGGPGLVAVGWDWSTDRPPDAAVWTSSDGSSWERVPHGDTFSGPSDQTMRAVTPGGPGLVAVGLSVHVPGEGPEAAVWVSTDGLTWSLVAHDPDSMGGEGDQEMNAVVLFGDRLVAVGLSGLIEDLDAAVWVVSENG